MKRIIKTLRLTSTPDQAQTSYRWWVWAAESGPPLRWIRDDSDSLSVFRTTCQDHGRPKNPLSGEPRALAANRFITRDNKNKMFLFWGIMAFKMWAGRCKLISRITADWMNQVGIVYRPARRAKRFTSVWYQFALISSSILPFLPSRQWGGCSVFPAAQSDAIYQCADTRRATKKKPESLSAICRNK